MKVYGLVLLTTLLIISLSTMDKIVRDVKFIYKRLAFKL